MEAIKKSILAFYFIQFKNGKFLVLEGVFLYFVAACMILAYGTLNHYNTFQLIPFLIPFLIGCWFFTSRIKITEESSNIKRWIAEKLNPFLFKNIKNIEEFKEHWRTQLWLLKDPKLYYLFNSDYDRMLEKQLDEEWLLEYGQMAKDHKYVTVHRFMPLALPVLVFIVVLIYG